MLSSSDHRIATQSPNRRFFIEKLAGDYREFYLDDQPIEAGTAYPLLPAMRIAVGPVIMRVEIEQ